MAPVTKRWLLLIVVTGAVLRFFPIWFGLPYPQARPDEETAIGKALDALEGRPNPKFFHWPSLTLYLFAGVLRIAALFEASNARGLTFSEQALATRAFVALAGTATVLVLFRLAKQIAGDRVALLAAAFLAAAILHVRESHFATTDVLMTLLLWGSLGVLFEALQVPAGAAVRTCAAAGVFAGLATSTKYNAAAVVAAMVAAQALLIRRTGVSIRVLFAAIAFGIAMVAAFFIATPYALLDFATFSRDLAYDVEHLSEGHRGIQLGRGWMYHGRHSLPYGLGIPLFVAGLIGIVPLLRHHRAAAIVLFSFGGAYYIATGSGQTVFFRYMLPVVPLLCLTAAVAVSWSADLLASRVPASRGAVFSTLVLLTLGPSLVQSAWFDVLLARTDTRVLASRWLTERIRPGDVLFDSGSAYTRLDIWHVPFERVEFDPASQSFGEQLPDWLVLQESPLLAYASTPAGVRALAEARYERVFSVRGIREGAAPGTYDQQDAFFLPFSGFSAVERPGPDIAIYRRRAPP